MFSNSSIVMSRWTSSRIIGLRSELRHRDNETCSVIGARPTRLKTTISRLILLPIIAELVISLLTDSRGCCLHLELDSCYSLLCLYLFSALERDICKVFNAPGIDCDPIYVCKNLIYDIRRISGEKKRGNFLRVKISSLPNNFVWIVSLRHVSLFLAKSFGLTQNWVFFFISLRVVQYVKRELRWNHRIQSFAGWAMKMSRIWSSARLFCVLCVFLYWFLQIN